MGTVKNARLIAGASDSTSDPVVVHAVSKLTCAPVEVGGCWEAQLFADDVGGVEVPRAGAVVADGRVAERLSIKEDLASAWARCRSVQRYVRSLSGGGGRQSYKGNFKELHLELQKSVKEKMKCILIMVLPQSDQSQ